MVFGELGEGKGKKWIYIKQSFKFEKIVTFVNVLTRKSITSYGEWPS